MGWALDSLSLFAAHCQVALDRNGPLILALFMTGLVGSAGHCAGMCGPFVLAQVGALRNAPGAGIERLAGAALWPYHLGRATTYVALGALLAAPIGLLGAVRELRWIPAAMLVLAAVLFLVQALRGWKLVGAIGTGAGKGGMLGRARGLFARPVGSRGYALGVVLGFLPCGLLYSALGAAAATGDPLAAGFGMLGFVLGTMPMLMAIGFLGRGAADHWRGLARKAMPVIAAVNAVVLLAMAWRLSGLA